MLDGCRDRASNLARMEAKHPFRSLFPPPSRAVGEVGMEGPENHCNEDNQRSVRKGRPYRKRERSGLGLKLKLHPMPAAVARTPLRKLDDHIARKCASVPRLDHQVCHFLEHAKTVGFVKTATRALLSLLGLLPMVLAAGAESAAPPRRASVLLAYDGSGDFGPQTPATRTDGWQEALDFCVREARDLYVQGGFGGRKAVYQIRDTIRFPAAQDFRVDGGVYVLNWEGPPEKDLLVLDSAMNCEYHLGILVYGGTGAAMRFLAEKPVPIDGFPVWIETQVYSQGMADPRPFQRGERLAGTGVVFDGSHAAITCCDFFFSSVLNFRTCIEMTGDVSFNAIRVPHLHTNADRGTLMTIGEEVFGNRMQFTIGVDQGATEVTGIVLGGRRNVVELGKRGSHERFPKGRALILTGTAEGNQINLVDSELEDPHEILTDQARVASNQLTWAGPALPIRKLESAGGQFSHTQRLYPATVRWSGGSVDSATLMRGGETLDLGKGTDREVLLSVGDELRLQSSAAPAIDLIPVKVR